MHEYTQRTHTHGHTVTGKRTQAKAHAFMHASTHRRTHVRTTIYALTHVRTRASTCMSVSESHFSADLYSSQSASNIESISEKQYGIFIRRPRPRRYILQVERQRNTCHGRQSRSAVDFSILWENNDDRRIGTNNNANPCNISHNVATDPPNT